MSANINVNTEILRTAATGSHGLCNTAGEIQGISQSMRSVGDNMRDALRSRYTGVLQESVARICNSMDAHAAAMQETGKTVLQIAERYETAEQNALEIVSE